MPLALFAPYCGGRRREMRCGALDSLQSGSFGVSDNSAMPGLTASAELVAYPIPLEPAVASWLSRMFSKSPTALLVLPIAWCSG